MEKGGIDMNKWSIGALVLGFGSLVLSLISDNLGEKGMREELIGELEEKYILVPRLEQKED